MTLMADWVPKRLDAVGKLCSGSTPSTSNPTYWGGGIVWITPNDLSKLNTPFLYETERTISEKGLKSCSATLLPPGSITLSSRAPIGYLAIPQVDFCTNQGCKSILLKQEYDAGFVYHNLNFHMEKIKRFGEGTTFSEISKTALAEIALPFPKDKSEQNQIAEILFTIDKAIEQTEAIIAKHQRIKAGLMQDLLTKGIDEHGNIRSEGTHAFKDSPLGRIPFEWDFSTVQSISELITKGESPGWQGFKYIEDGVLFITSENVRDGYLDISINKKYIPAAFHRKLKRSILKKGDVLINLVGASIARSAIYNIQDEANINQAVAIIRLKKSINNDWFLSYLQLPNNIARLLGEQVETARANISLTDIRKFRIFIPKIDEQERLSKIITALDHDTKQNIQLFEKLKSIKSGLMKDLFSEKVRVTNLLKQEDIL